MKWLLISVLILCVLGLLAYITMALQSQKRPKDIGLFEGMLRICPNSPNCVCSEKYAQTSPEHAISPIPDSDGKWQQLISNIEALGGKVEHNDGEYLHVIFVSPVFRYVDDVELRRDAGAKLIHIRSASRVGRSDFGVNRKRVEAIVAGLQ